MRKHKWLSICYAEAYQNWLLGLDLLKIPLTSLHFVYRQRRIIRCEAPKVLAPPLETKPFMQSNHMEYHFEAWSNRYGTTVTISKFPSMGQDIKKNDFFAPRWPPFQPLKGSVSQVLDRNLKIATVTPYLFDQALNQYPIWQDCITSQGCRRGC